MKTGTWPDAPFPTPPGIVYRAGKVGKGHICPRCDLFIAAHSPIVRLYRPERPNSLDGRQDATTGKYYYYDGRKIDMKPRWLVHERCWEAGRPAPETQVHREIDWALGA